MNNIGPQEFPAALIRDKLQQNLHIAETVNNFRAQKRAAVLVPFVEISQQWHILFTRRSEAVNDHKGQVSFPGGAVEESDENEIQTALRETYEETGISRGQVEILGGMEKYRTVTRYEITPIIGKIDWPVATRLNPDEVERIFTIPVNWLSELDHFHINLWHAPDGVERRVIFYDLYDGEQLWGISAQITVRLLNILGLFTDAPFSL